MSCPQISSLTWYEYVKQKLCDFYMGLTSATPRTTSFNNQHLPYLMKCFLYCVIMIIAKGVQGFMI